MKKLFALGIALVAAFVPSLRAQFQFSNFELVSASGTGTGNVDSGATWSFNSGCTVNFGGAVANQLLYATNASGTLAPLTLGAGLSITGGTLAAASSTSHNPTATIGLAAVNGSAGSFMTSDSAPPLSQAIVPTWTGLHSFDITSNITVGSDYGIKILPTLNQRNATNFSMVYGNETVTQAGTGNQYLEELAVGGTDQWVVDSTGTVQTGAWNGSVIPDTKGGSGTVTGVLGADGAGNVAAVTAGIGIAITTGPNTISLTTIANNDLLANITGSTASPSANTLSAVIDSAIGSTQGDILYRDTGASGAAGAWKVLAPGTSGQFLKTLGASANPVWASVGINSTTAHDVATYSNSTGGFEDNGTINATSTAVTITAANTNGIVNVTNNAGGTANLPMMTMLAPNQTTTQENGLLFGVQSASLNLGTMYFKYVGNGSASNAIAFGFYGVSDAATLNTAGLWKTAAIQTTAAATIGTKISSYNGVSTAGWGVPAVNGFGRSTAQSGAVASVASYTVGGSDGSFEVSSNVNVTAATTNNFTVTCTYTDETNTSRVLTMGFTQLSGATLLTAITNVTGTGPYESPVYHIRCKASTAITIATTGTFTSVAYNVEGQITQID